LDSAALHPKLERWSRDHALAMSCALAATLLLGRVWLLAIAACVSFTVLLVRSRGQWTASGAFGAANTVTAGRLLLELVMTALLAGTAGPWLAALVVLALVLDGVDGWLARRLGTGSAFGAHFDMEVDAFLVLTTSVLLWSSGKCGAWILVAGGLRYGYVLCCAVSPPRGGAMPRTLLGRSAFALVVVGHALGLALSGASATLAAALGTTAVTLSFARSFWYGYASPAKSIVDT
jgi:phosphatidylglycerophosphate synthase